MTPDGREKTIKTLEEIRECAAMDLATMPAVKQGSPWAIDRQRAVEWANRQLTSLGANLTESPTHAP